MEWDNNNSTWLLQLKSGQIWLAAQLDTPVLDFFQWKGKRKKSNKKTKQKTICHNQPTHKTIKHTHSQTVQLVDQGTLFLQIFLSKPPGWQTLSTSSSASVVPLVFAKKQLRQIENWIAALVMFVWSPSSWCTEWEKILIFWMKSVIKHVMLEVNPFWCHKGYLPTPQAWC